MERSDVQTGAERGDEVLVKPSAACRVSARDRLCGEDYDSLA